MLLSGANVHEKYGIVLGEYEEACEKYLMKIRDEEGRKERPPWMSQELKCLVRQKANLWNKYTMSGKEWPKPLQIVFKNSYSEGEVPEEWGNGKYYTIVQEEEQTGGSELQAGVFNVSVLQADRGHSSG